MSGDDRYTAYCGLYCKDCIPSNERLFATVDSLDALLEEVRFENYAALKAKGLPVFADYVTFKSVLRELKTLRCKALCTEGGCKENCRIRGCVMEKGIRGCWLCEKFEACELHESLKSYHPALVHNLLMIKSYGPDDWSDKRGKHYRWSR
ncbi:MAG TPA: DUF3795 domain-containing protein [Methanocella sp.]|jgi:hypothetical protein